MNFTYQEDLLMEERKNQPNYISIITAITSAATILIAGIFIIYGLKNGMFESQQSLEAFIGKAGIFGPLIFIFIQAIQVVIPILPGFVTCIAGAVVFGPLEGFIYSYTGMCLGSMMAFYISRKYGTAFVKKLVKPQTYDKYILWLEKGKKFDILFLLAIFLPAAPDDVLCFIAGLTRMTWKKFTIIILLGKPFVIALYSLATAGVLNLPNIM